MIFRLLSILLIISFILYFFGAGPKLIARTTFAKRRSFLFAIVVVCGLFILFKLI